jgi:hypothetical protein
MTAASVAKRMTMSEHLLPAMLLAAHCHAERAIATVRRPAAAAPAYSVAITDRSLAPGGGSIISQVNGTSEYRYNFNAAWLPLPGNPGGGLFLRVTDTDSDMKPIAPATTSAETDRAEAVSLLGRGCAATLPNSTQSHSLVAFVRSISPDGLLFEKVTPASLIVPVAPSLDPRAIYRPQTGEYFLTYQCNFPTGSKRLLRKTFVASTHTPENISSWRDVATSTGGKPTPMFAAVDGEEQQDCGTCVFFPMDSDIDADGDGKADSGGATQAPSPPAFSIATFGGLRGGNLSLAVSHDSLRTWQTQGRLLTTRPGGETKVSFEL